MAWGNPKHNSKCHICKKRGRCSCQRQANAEIARNPSARPHPCSKCGRTVRGGVCPGPNC